MTKTIWNEQKLAKLRELYPTMASGDIADIIGCADVTVRNMAHKLGLKKSKDFSSVNYIGRYTGTQGLRKPRKR